MEKLFDRFASATAHATGRPITFILCVMMVVIWATTGPLFHYSETWQLIINTGTTIITFLMVFLIQNTQNRDGRALQTKLDELIRTSNAENDMMGIEKLTDKELDALHKRSELAAAHAQKILHKTRREKESRGGQSEKSHPQAGQSAPTSSSKMSA